MLASQLNDEQRAAYSAIVAALDDPTTGVRGNAFYVDGPGGAGKTFLYEALMRLVHGRGQIALACAMSGIAATLLPGGTTAHSLFGLPLDMPSHGASSSIRAQDGRAEVLRRATLIVWDEASMVPAAALDCVDRLLRDLMASTTPFGGKLLVMGGDFRQLLPVMPKATEAEIVANTILWHYTMRDGTFQRFTLAANMRLLQAAGSSTRHQEWLLRLGEGRLVGEPELHPLAVPLPRHLCADYDETIEAFVDWVYPEVREHTGACFADMAFASAGTWLAARAILAPRNEHVQTSNAAVLERLDPSTDFVSFSHDTSVDPEHDDSAAFPEEFLNSLTPEGLPEHKLCLRRGAVIIVLRNLDKDRGICNGCRGIVCHATARILDMRVITGPAKGSRVLLPRIPFRTSPGSLPFVMRRRQFPVRLAWAMSVHKAQGQTLKRCGVCLHTPVFAHGQLYVAAPRTGSAAGLRVWLGGQLGHGYQDDEDNEFTGPYTHNLVYSTIIRMVLPNDRKDTDDAAIATVVEPPASAASSIGGNPQPPHIQHVDSTPMGKYLSDEVEPLDLDPGGQARLHRALLCGTKLPAPEETGADLHGIYTRCTPGVASSSSA